MRYRVFLYRACFVIDETRNNLRVSFWDGQQNSKDDQVKDAEEDQKPHRKGEFLPKLLLFAGRRTQCQGRAFGGHKSHRNTQAYRRMDSGMTHFRE